MVADTCHNNPLSRLYRQYSASRYNISIDFVCKETAMRKPLLLIVGYSESDK